MSATPCPRHLKWGHLKWGYLKWGYLKWGYLRRTREAAAQPTQARCKARGFTAARGFTMVELMVALTGGLFVALAVFSLASHSSHFYQSETRIAVATMSSVMGFERLRADIARAGFLTSPNIRRDPRVCGQPETNANWAQGLAGLQSIFIEPDQYSGHKILDTRLNNNIKPDRITLAGSYGSIDQFPVHLIEPGAGAGDTIYLQQKTGPMARIKGNISSVFLPGRGVRIVDKSGHHHYGSIASASNGGATGQPQITLSATPGLIFRRNTTLTCGLKGFETGAQVNVVNFIRYSLQDLSDSSKFPQYAPVYDSNESSPWDWLGDAERTRLELTREELDTSGSVISGTQELVAELAVDLAFGLTVRTDRGDDQQTLAYFNAKQPGQISTWAGSIASSNAQPQRVRSLRARLAVRSRQADRRAGIPGGLYRIDVTGIRGAGSGRPKWARVRMMQAEIALHNQMGIVW